MIVSLDSNVVSSVLSGEPSAPTIAGRLDGISTEGHQALICGVVFAELLAHPFSNEPRLRDALDRLQTTLDFDFTEAMWTTAGERYARYAQRRRASTGQLPRRLLADFLIGPHALHRADQLLTLDPKRYEQDFPELRLATVALA